MPRRVNAQGPPRCGGRPRPLGSDVQHALAREYGQDSWIALKGALDDLAFSRQSRAERVEQVLRHAWDGDLSVARRLLTRDPKIATDSLFTAGNLR